MKKQSYILITGCTGVGKSTVATYLASEFGMEYFDDPYVNNPFLSNALNREKSTAFQSQLYFFTEFIKLHFDISKYNHPVIQERSIYESVHIFCEMYYHLGIFTKEELSVFKDLLSVVSNMLKEPDIIIYLRSTPATIYHRLRQRNRDLEKDINEKYTETQLALYEKWIKFINQESHINLIEIDNTHLSISQCNELIGLTLQKLLRLPKNKYL
ncbi:deoxynucleoside kinase [Rikenella microfusus]|uniref:Deoxyadenosine/deoxycytidine kinase n=2 Tax=Rikenella microfusus TaxID=28139 RepID=A0A379MVB7_9BACT|nr:deoxynucleoside kinase [Rikenella microfusus]SUE34582.1 Deoxyadenosine/deoxycytidine kinase [Rikenella microfusus]